MKKIFVLFALLAFLLVPLKTTFAVDAVKDQANDSSIGSGYMTLYTSTTTRAQTFSPTKKYLDSVDVYLKDRVKGSWVEATIIAETTGAVLATSGTRMDDGDGWQTISISATLDTNIVYRVKIYNENSLNVKWTYNNTNPYSGGMAWSGLSTYNELNDFNFRTYGHDDPIVVEEKGTPSPESSNSSSPAVITSKSTGDTPLVKTNANIKPPSALSAELDQDKKSINLKWTKSDTSDITGYRIFRSELKTTNFVKIGQTGKSITEYVDISALSSKTYYYYVRAIKDNDESASSNTVEISLPDATEEAKSAQTIDTDSENVNNDKNNSMSIIYLYSGLSIILIILIYIFVAMRKKYWPFNMKK